MKCFTKRIVSALLVLCMILSLTVAGLAAPSAQAIITEATGYTSAADVVYNTTDGIIANWGARGEISDFLSTYAEAFYTGDYTYDTLAKLDGGTSTSNAPSSALYTALQDLMVDNHTSFTTYSGSGSLDCKKFYPYTDCVSGDTTKVSLIYRGGLVSSTWDSGATYNQEHVWPNSKCIGSNSTDIGDIMHLRPANPSENSSRGNTAYGESSGYYDPGVSVRGDCARTVLYMYTRWGNTGNMWGTSGVIESLDVLLKWMAEDPVDTWEMGRNDAVQSITGTRNVYVDYPELAWQLFGVAEPADLTTPSGGGDGATGSTATTATLVTDVTSLKAGDQIIIVATDYAYALSTTQNNNNRGQAAIVKSDDLTAMSFGADTQLITLEAGTVSGTFAFNVGEAGYLYAASGSSNQLKSTTTLNDNGSWAITIDAATGVASVTASGTNARNVMQYNSSSKIFACYGSASQKTISIYKVDEAGSDIVVPEPEPEDTTAATLVTNVASLKAGMQIVIVAAESDYALSTTQNNNNRGQADVTKSADGKTVNFGADAQVITLEAGVTEGTFAFSVGEGSYLYAPSSSSNHLKTTSTLGENGSWTITIDDATGVASIIAGSVSRNDLRYNASSSLFSCYAAGNTQAAVSIYGIGEFETPEVTPDPEPEPEPDPEPTTSTATLVTDVTSLQAGDKIIIVATDYAYALSTTQNGNNRGQAEIVKSDDLLTVTYTDATQVITLEAGTVDGTFAFNVGDLGYLYAASNSSNYLRSTTTLNDNGSWAITIDASTGAASIIASGTNTRNVMQYNSSSKIFACYGSASQKGISIYKVNESAAAPDPDYYLFGYINGANYGCEEDAANMGEYKFVDGTLTATFASDSYVAVKTTDNAAWYMTDGWQGEVTSATLYNTANLGETADKLLVPGGVEVVFTLVVNADGTLTLSYVAEEPPVVEPEYYLAGTMNGWTEKNADYQLAQDGDVYKITVALTAGTHEFKVTDGTWANAWPSGNYVAVTAEDCNATITFNPTTGEITVEGLVEPAPEPVNYYVAGTFNEWIMPDANMLMTQNGDVYVLTLYGVTAGEHQFKVTDGTWDTAWPSSNYVLTIPADSNITITFNPANGEITVDGIEEAPVVKDSKDIKWQITSGTSADSASTNLRLVSWVDSVANYSSVTFNVTINGVTAPLVCTTAYTAIKASGLSISNPAGVFGEETANYFVTHTIMGIPASMFDSEILVTVTWTDLEGNTVTSDVESIVISNDWA